MPPDLGVDVAVMAALINDLSRAEDSARAVHAGHEQARRVLDGAAGEASVERAVGHFFGKWRYGCGLLAGDVGTLRGWLCAVESELAQTEAGLAAELATWISVQTSS